MNRRTAPMLSPSPHPTPDEIHDAPETCALAMLDHALFAASMALLSANDDVKDASTFRAPRDRQGSIAEAILRVSEVLQNLLHRYRQCATPAYEDQFLDDDRPF
jgi:hypothetical protein